MENNRPFWCILPERNLIQLGLEKPRTYPANMHSPYWTLLELMGTLETSGTDYVEPDPYRHILDPEKL